MYKRSNIEGVYVKGNTHYRIEANRSIEVSEGSLKVTTYDPSPVLHELDIQEDTILRNDTNKDQYIYAEGMVGPVTKQVQNTIRIKQGRERNFVLRPQESMI